jgi:cob(I)alamin adenosyltransferase
VVAYGVVDELNSQLGLVLAGGVPEPMRPVLERVQNELFDLGADLSLPAGKEGLRVEQGRVDALEAECDRFNADLPALKSFVLPGGTETAAGLHAARTVCRRAELEALRVPDANPAVRAYLNRLSDLLFILARAANADAGEDEPLWKPGSSQQP